MQIATARRSAVAPCNQRRCASAARCRPLRVPPAAAAGGGGGSGGAAPGKEQQRPQQQDATSSSSAAAPPSEQQLQQQRLAMQQRMMQQRRPMLGPNGGPLVMGPDGQPVEMVRLDTRPDAFSGVAAVDRGENDAPTSAGRAALLVAGDLAVLLAFAAVGRANHGEPVTVVDTLGTALPFILGWFAAGGLLGGFGAEAQGGKTGPAAVAAAKVWAVGVPLAVVLRSIGRGYVPAVSFMVVSMVGTGVLMVGWRATLAALTPEAEALTPAQQAARRSNRQGGVLDGLKMVMSLVKRW